MFRIILKLKWLNKKEGLLINLLTLREKLETHLETTMDKATQFTLMETSILEIMLTVSVQGKENTCMLMETVMREHLTWIRSMELVDSSQNKKDSITVHFVSFRAMVERDQAWGGNICLCEQRFVFWMVDVRKETRKRNLHL